jgi:hypothetical protein
MNPFALMPYDNLTFTLYNQEREKEKQLAKELGTLTQYRWLTSNYINTLAYILSDETSDDIRDERLFGMALLSESVFDTTDERLLSYGYNLRAVISYIRNKLSENKEVDSLDEEKTRLEEENKQLKRALQTANRHIDMLLWIVDKLNSVRARVEDIEDHIADAQCVADGLSKEFKYVDAMNIDGARAFSAALANNINDND